MTIVESDNEDTVFGLQSAIATGEILRVRYSGGSSPGGIREIIPRSIKLPDHVACLCLNDNKVKSFRIDRIEIIKSPEQEYEWERKFEILRMSMIKNVILNIGYKKFKNSDELKILAHPYSFSGGCARFEFRANDRKSVSSMVVSKIQFTEDYSNLKYEASSDTLEGWFGAFLVSQRCPEFSFCLKKEGLEVFLKGEKVAWLFKSKRDYILNSLFANEIFGSPRDATWFLLKNLYRAKALYINTSLKDVESL